MRKESVQGGADHRGAEGSGIRAGRGGSLPEARDLRPDLLPLEGASKRQSPVVSLRAPPNEITGYKRGPMTCRTSDMQAILERLARLERQNRRLKLGSVAAVAVLGALALMAQDRPQTRTLEAQHFVLKDNNGVVRGRWDADASGSNLALFDRQQNDRVQLASYD